MLNLIVAVAALLTAGWKVSQFLRAPGDRELQVVTTCTIFVAVALVAQYIAALYHTAGGIGTLIQFVLVTWFFALLIFLLQSALHPESLWRWGRIELGLVFLANMLLLGTYLTTSPASSWPYKHSGMDPEVLSVYLVEDVTLLYATLRGASLAWSANGRVPRAVGVSLRIAAIGLFWNAFLVHIVRVLSTSNRLVSAENIVPATIDERSQTALTVGIVIFSLGIAYPGLRTIAIKTRLRARAYKRYRSLYPLWAVLQKAFPAIALDGAIGPVRDRMVVQRLRFKYYRRVIECRDGLLHLSPYIREPADTTGRYTMALQASMVEEALQRRYRGDRPSGVVVTIAAPATTDSEDDVRQLVRLARAFDTAERTGTAD